MHYIHFDVDMIQDGVFTLYSLCHNEFILKIGVAWSRMLHALFNVSYNLSRNRSDIEQNYFQIACFD